MPWSGSRQTFVAHSACDSTIGHSRRGSRCAVARVEQDRVEHGAEDVVLALVEGAVADPHRARAGVAGEVVARRLGQVAPAVDPVHDLQRAVLGRLDVGDELHELVGLPVEVEPVQRLQREGRVAHPRVAVVPVALAARRLRQRRRQRGDGRAGRHVRQALDRERRALDRVAEAVVGDARAAEPGAPEADASRRSARRPRRRLPGAASSSAQESAQYARSPGLEHVPPADAVALDAEREVRAQADRLAGAASRRRRAGRRRRASTRPARGRSRTPARRRARPRRWPSRHSTVRTSMWSASSSAGGRVCGVTASSWSRGPIVSASRTTIQPVGVFHVVTSTFVPGS